MTNEELIKKAASVIKSVKINNFTTGDVGCALETDGGNIYTGVCIDTMSSMGFCAEHNAIGTMVTNQEYKIKKIVAEWKDPKDENKIFVIPPCGRCRQFIKETNEENLNTEIILDKNKSEKLEGLLPYHDWWQEQK